MNSDQFEAKMRALEYYHPLRLVPNTWVIIRVDGKGFTKLTEKSGFDKPFDEDFSFLMRSAACDLIEAFNGIYAYTESDEISVLLPYNYDLYDRSVEKLVSISASIASVSFSCAENIVGIFDSRAIIAANKETVVDYFRWRMADAERCALNGYCYWTLRHEGVSVAKATSTLHGKGPDFKNELLFQHGINFNDIPGWQKRGIGIHWDDVLREGKNPITEEEVDVWRRQLTVDDQLPMKDAYSTYMNFLIDTSLAERRGKDKE